MKNILFNEIEQKAKNRFKNENASIAALYEQYCEELNHIDALSNENKNIVLKALLRAKMSLKEQEIYLLSNELENIRKEIKIKENELQIIAKNSFDELSKLDLNDIQREFLEELMLNEASSLQILYETAQNAFINVLENSVMIEERCFLISNFMLINALEYARFNKDKIISAAELILRAATDLANEWQSYADELLEGALNGLLEGIFAILERLKKDLELSLSDAELDTIKCSLLGLERDFIAMIKQNLNADVSGKALENILNNKLDNNFAKFARLVRENKQLLNIKLIDFQNSELNEKIKKELNTIEKDMKKAYQDFDVKKLAKKLMEKFRKN